MPAANQWTLKADDEFNTSKLNAGLWSVGEPWNAAPGFVQSDDAYCPLPTSGQVTESAGALQLNAIARPTQGKPLQTWSPAEDWVYVLEWDVHDGSKYLSAAGGATYREPVEVVDRDPAPSFVGCNLPNELIAGKIEKITVGLQNNGPDTYKKGRDKVVVHWYYMDGTEASFNDEVLPLQEDVPPFSRVQVDVPDDLAEQGTQETGHLQPPTDDTKHRCCGGSPAGRAARLPHKLVCKQCRQWYANRGPGLPG